VKKSRTSVATAALAALALVLAGCGGVSPAAGGESTTPAKGGAVTVLLSAGGLSQWPSLDPVSAGQANSDFRNAVFGELFHQGANGKIEPDLASGYDLSDDGRTLTVTLRKGVTFSDGTPFDAAAVQKAWQRALDPANGCQCVTTFSAVDATEARGDDTLVMTLSRPFPAVVNAFISTALNWIPSPKAIDGMSEADFGLKPVGAGPFVVDSNDPSQRLVLSRNPTYFKENRPYLDKLTFQSIGSDQSAYAGLQSGTAQMVEGMTTVPLLTQGKTAFNLVPVPSTGVWMTQFNSKPGSALADQTAREALRYATDTKALNDVLFDGLNKLTQSPTASGGLFHTEKVDNYIAYDLDKAKQLMAQVPGKIRVRLMTSSSNVGLQAAQALQAMWNKIGVETEISQPDLAGKQERVKNGDWEVLFGFGGAFDPALNLGTASFFGSKGPNSGTADPELDQLIADAAKALDAKERGDLYRKAFQLLSDKSYANFLFENQTFNLVAKTGIRNYDQDSRWIAWDQVSAS
jgi:peptide/nickel transport system substrate-binding protein